MIDSIDLIILNVENLDFLYLKNVLKITNIKRYRNNQKKSYSYSFKYKDITFKYNATYKYLLIITLVKKLLNKMDITLSDKSTYESIVNNIIKEVLKSNKFVYYVSRIDYCVDIQADEYEYMYIKLLNKHRSWFKYMVKKRKYETSVHLNNKYGGTNFNFYSKYPECKEIEYRGIIRLEIQVKRAKINNELKSFGILRCLDNYWNKDAMDFYFFEYIKPYFYEGDYYKKQISKQIINNSDYSRNMQDKLKKFILLIEVYGIDNIIKRKICCDSTYKSYVEKLNKLNVNPICIPKEWKYDKLTNLLKLAKEKAMYDYFK